jgi:molecular chaperone DnaK (HSP70)
MKRNPHLLIVANQTVILVADFGGGTVDVSVHLVMDRPQGAGLDPRIKHEWQLAEVISPAGDNCGSRAVDTHFQTFVKELFERAGAPREYVAFAESREMSKLLSSWEESKENFQFNDCDFVELNFCDVISAIQPANPEIRSADLLARFWNESPRMEPWRNLRAAGDHSDRTDSNRAEDLSRERFKPREC